MAQKRKKRKKRPQARGAAASRKGRARAGEPRGELLPAPARRWMGLGLDIALALVCILFLVKSARYAARAEFFTDECFHTYIVEEIVARGNSPATLRALYSNMPNNTHPLFHWLGAALYLVDGRAALPYLNVILCGAMLGLLYWLLRAWASPTAARIAVAIPLLFSVVHVCTQIFYMEILSALLFMLAVFTLYLAVGRTNWRLHFLAGAACALSLLSKQVGYVLIPVVALCGLYLLVVGRWRHALGIAIVAATFAAGFAIGMNALSSKPFKRFRTIYAPLERDLLPKKLRIFSARSPADTGPADTRPVATAADSVAGDLQAAGGGVTAGGGEPAGPLKFDSKKALKQSFGRSPSKILAGWVDVVGPFGLALTLLCLVHLFVGRPTGATAPLLLALASLLAAAMYIGTVDKRHFISAIPVLAACVGIALSDLLGRVRRYGHVAALAVSAVLIVSAAVVVARVPSYRDARPPAGPVDRKLTLREKQWKKWWPLGCNVPRQLVEAARAIAENDCHKQPVFSMWTSSTWYYSGHPTTWAGVNVPKLNTMMLGRDPWPAFRPYYRNHIRHLLIDNRRIMPDALYAATGLGYSETFCRNVSDMLRLGAMRIIHPSREAIADYSERNPTRPFWGNPEIPYIVVEFDHPAFHRLLISGRLTEPPAVTPER